jgi:hypothetical protein
VGICEVAGCNKEVWYLYRDKEIRMICELHNKEVNKGKKIKFKSGYVKKTRIKLFINR